MAKGQEAKSKVDAKIKEVFGNNYIGNFNNKIYVWSQENGEQVQVAISLTCPKVPIDTTIYTGGDLNFEDPEIIPVQTAQRVEITEEEKNKVQELLKALGDF